jgi:hypothetical protein
LTLPVRAQSGRVKPGADEWTRYELAKGALSVLLPAKPLEEFKQSPPDTKVTVDLYIYSVQRPHGVLVAQYSLLGEVAETWSETSIESFYNGVWDGAALGFNNKMQKAGSELKVVLVEKRIIKFNNHDGREVRFTLGALKGRMLMTLIGREAFLAMVMRTDEMAIEDEEKFLNSYTIKVAPRAGKTASLRN